MKDNNTCEIKRGQFDQIDKNKFQQTLVLNIIEINNHWIKFQKLILIRFLNLLIQTLKKH